MGRLKPEKLQVSFLPGVTHEDLTMPRRYTLTHSDCARADLESRESGQRRVSRQIQRFFENQNWRREVSHFTLPDARAQNIELLSEIKIFKFVFLLVSVEASCFLVIRRRMQTTLHKRKSDKRLERLMCSGLRPTEDLEKYAAELRQLAGESSDPKSLRRQSRLLKALANETRLGMLRLLTTREMCVCELTVALNLTQPTASHHLNILQNVGLIKDRKEGKWVFYSVAKPEIIQNLFEFLEFPR